MSGEKNKRNTKHPDSRYERIIANSKPELSGFFDSVNERMKNLVIAKKSYKSRNSKELSVQPGDLFEVLDDDGTWWCLRAPSGKTGHVPQNHLELIPNPLTENSHVPNSSPEPIVIQVPVIIKTHTQTEEPKAQSPAASIASTSKVHSLGPAPTFVPEPSVQMKVERVREQVKAPIPKSLKKLRKMRKDSTAKLTKKRPGTPTLPVSSASSSDSSSSSSSDDDSTYENDSRRKAKSNKKKTAARKASPAPKLQEVITKHCCELLKSNLDSKHSCMFANMPRPAETGHCCDTMRCCCQNHYQPTPSQNRSRFEDGWHSQSYSPRHNQSSSQPRETRQTPSPRQESSATPQTQQQRDNPPMIILLETPQSELAPESEYQEDIYGGQSAPIQIMLTSGDQFTSQLTAASQFQQQPIYCYPNNAAQTAPTNQWPTSPYYLYT